jgi:hypothetical protein
LEGREGLAHIEPELGVERQRTVVVCGLDKADAGEVPLPSPLQHVFHQPSADRAVLHSRINGDRTDAGDRRGFPKEIAADHAPVCLGHDRVDVAAREQGCDQLLRNLRRGKVTREVVSVGDRLKCRVADHCAGFDIVGRAGSQPQVHRKFLPAVCGLG